MAKMAIVKRKR